MAGEKPLTIHVDSQSTNIQEIEENEENGNIRNRLLFFGMCKCPETPRQRDGRMRRQYSDMGDNYHRLIDELLSEGHQRIDKKVLMVLEYMRELYVRKLQVLKKMFPSGAKEEFVAFFKKVGEAMPQVDSNHDDLWEFRTIKRSHSFGRQGLVSRGLDHRGSETPMRMERFKITTVNTGGGPAGDGGDDTAGGSTAGQGGTKK